MTSSHLQGRDTKPIMSTGGLTMVRLMCAFAVMTAILGVIPGTSRLGTMAQQPQCLHAGDETPEQVARRRLALAVVRRINSAQIQQFARAKTYQPLGAFTDIQTPAGFSTQLIVNGTGYAVSIKDTLDPCAFAYFSDHDGVIYTAQALR